MSRLFPLGRRSNPLVRLGVPALEGALAIAIVAMPQLALAAGAATLTALGVYVLTVSARRSGMTCNCFGAIMPSKIGTSLAVRNLVLAAAAAGVSYASAAAGVESIRPGVAAAGAWAALLIVALTELLRIHRRWTESGWRPARG